MGGLGAGQGGGPRVEAQDERLALARVGRAVDGVEGVDVGLPPGGEGGEVEDGGIAALGEGRTQGVAACESRTP